MVDLLVFGASIFGVLVFGVFVCGVFNGLVSDLFDNFGLLVSAHLDVFSIYVIDFLLIFDFFFVVVEIALSAYVCFHQKYFNTYGLFVFGFKNKCLSFVHHK